MCLTPFEMQKVSEIDIDIPYKTDIKVDVDDLQPFFDCISTVKTMYWPSNNEFRRNQEISRAEINQEVNNKSNLIQFEEIKIKRDLAIKDLLEPSLKNFMFGATTSRHPVKFSIVSIMMTIYQKNPGTYVQLNKRFKHLLELSNASKFTIIQKQKRTLNPVALNSAGSMYSCRNRTRKNQGKSAKGIFDQIHSEPS